MVVILVANPSLVFTEYLQCICVLIYWLQGKISKTWQKDYLLWKIFQKYVLILTTRVVLFSFGVELSGLLIGFEEWGYRQTERDITRA